MITLELKEEQIWLCTRDILHESFRELLKDFSNTSSEILMLQFEDQGTKMQVNGKNCLKH